MRKVIIDTDPGTDDALAIMMALNSSDLSVEGITTVGGNATLAHTTRNALRVVEHLEVTDVPIARGASRPLHGFFTYAYHIHGSAGLGVRLPEPKSKPHPVRGDEFIYNLVSAFPHQLTIIALGPLTNVAIVLQEHPDIADKINGIVVMGGAVEVLGNVTPHAEFNIYDDPWGANVVFSSGVPITLAGLDVTHQTYFHRDDGPHWFGGTSRSAQLGNLVLANRFQARPDLDEFHLHDPLAVAAAIQPDILTYRQATVSVVCEGDERGRTSAIYGYGQVKVAVAVEVERSVEIVRNLIQGEK